jgi:hypothetical protein
MQAPPAGAQGGPPADGLIGSQVTTQLPGCAKLSIYTRLNATLRRIVRHSVRMALRVRVRSRRMAASTSLRTRSGGQREARQRNGVLPRSQELGRQRADVVPVGRVRRHRVVEARAWLAALARGRQRQADAAARRQLANGLAVLVNCTRRTLHMSERWSTWAVVDPRVW